MVSVGGNVEATTYNDMVTRLNAILGIGTGKLGYGYQITTPGEASAGTSDIEAVQWAGLRSDFNVLTEHQTNNLTAIGTIEAGNIIGADESNVGTGSTVLRDASDVFTIVNPDANKGVNDFIPLITTLEANATTNTVFSSHLVLESKITPATGGASYTSSWQSLTAEIEVTFAGGYNCRANNGTLVAATADDHRRHFFNTGGEIRFSTSGSNGSGTKDADWSTMLTNFGTIAFANDSTTTTGTATVGAGFGSEDLTTSYQQIAVKFGSDSLYAENSIKVEAKTDLAGKITFKFSWTDADSGDPFTDETVNLDIDLTMSQVRCNGPISSITPSYAFVGSGIA